MIKITEENILNALRNVDDPDLHKDLVTLNMIENIKVNGNNISFDVILTTPACPLKNKIKEVTTRIICINRLILIAFFNVILPI